VQVAALRRADPPSKEFYRMYKKIEKLKKQPESNKDTNIQPSTQQSFYLSTLHVSTTMDHLQVFSVVFSYTLFTVELQGL
jgi:carbonic anhydrase